MSTSQPPADGAGRRGHGTAPLERLTAAVLVCVLVSLGWMALAACQPGLSAAVALPVQVVVVVALLVAALALVSTVALLHTRS
jgi:hypothetical protein